MPRQRAFHFADETIRAPTFRLLDVSRIYLEPAVETYQPGREVLEQVELTPRVAK
jgi:hypothetical protein